MAEPTLNLKMSDLASQVGFYLGYGLGVEGGQRAWTDRQQRSIDMILASGLRQFYKPPVDGGGHWEWSFLRPSATFTLAAGGTEIEMPSDFGWPEGPITASADGSSWWPVEVTNEGLVRQMAAVSPSTTGPPQAVAVAPQKGTGPARAPKTNLVFFPAADREFTIRTQYELLPDALTPASPWAYGGAAHAETLLESCLAIAEQRLDNTMGVHTQKFQMMLAASISADRKRKGQHLGYNRDLSDSRHRTDRQSWRGRGDGGVTFDGVLYD